MLGIRLLTSWRESLVTFELVRSCTWMTHLYNPEYIEYTSANRKLRVLVSWARMEPPCPAAR